MNVVLEILLWITYLVSLYFSVFWLLVFLEKGSFFSRKDKETKKFPDVSVIIPAYNEEETVLKTANSVLSLDYPKEHLQLIIVNDGSKDNTRKVIEEWMKDRTENILFINQINKGKGAAMNEGLKKVTGTFFACLDADSTVDKDALKKMISVYQEHDKNLAIVTPIMFINKPKSIWQKLQSIEYILSMFVAKLMAMVDCQYVAPGPFSLYRTAVIREIGGFDEHNLTEDQEIAYRVQANHYKITQCTSAKVLTNGPEKIKALYAQRNRWFKGGLINVLKYKHLMLNKQYGDFGIIQMSINLVMFFLSMSAIVFFAYYLVWPFISQFYDLYLVGFDIWPYLNDLKFTFTILNINIEKLFIVNILFIITLGMMYFAHKLVNQKVRAHGGIVLIPYFLFYYLVLSLIAVIVFIEYSIGKKNQRW